MSVSKRDLDEIKDMYGKHPKEVRKVLDGNLINLKKNIIILRTEINKIKPVLDQINNDHLDLTKERSKLIVKQLDGSPLTEREKISLNNINKEINELHEYTTKERPRFRKLEIDLDVHLDLKKNVETLLDAIKQMKGGRRKSLKKKKSNKN